MAVTYIPTKGGQGYIVLCLSSDTKPVSTAVATLIETNTAIGYYPDGIGGWTPESTGSGITQITGDLLAGPGSGSVAGTIPNDTVTFAKMQNAAANSFIARVGGSSGDMSDVALAASQLAGRGSTGDVAAIDLGLGLHIVGTTMSSRKGAWVEIDEVIMPGGTSTATFSSIPQDYKHLVVIGRGRDSTSGTGFDVFMRFNGDSGSNYLRQYLFATGSTVTAALSSGLTSMSVGVFPGATATPATVGQFEMLIPWYSSNAFNKTGVSTLGSVANTGSGVFVGSGLSMWSNNVVITQIDIIATGNFNAGTAFELYGLIYA